MSFSKSRALGHLSLLVARDRDKLPKSKLPSVSFPKSPSSPFPPRGERQIARPLSLSESQGETVFIGHGSVGRRRCNHLELQWLMIDQTNGTAYAMLKHADLHYVLFMFSTPDSCSSSLTVLRPQVASTEFRDIQRWQIPPLLYMRVAVELHTIHTSPRMSGSVVYTCGRFRSRFNYLYGLLLHPKWIEFEFQYFSPTTSWSPAN